jgi:hypothetical protein
MNPDPQLAALGQYVTTKIKSWSGKTVVDYGSGFGVLPDQIDALWPAGVALPRYCAVDLNEPLNRLSLPPRVHNGSQKVRAAEFSQWLPMVVSDVAGLVVRNVLHELNITETAELLSVLAEKLPTTCEEYLQDIELLPTAERGRAGWERESLLALLQEVGFSVTAMSQVSFGGTPWFSMVAIPTGRSLPVKDAVKRTIHYRDAQRGKLLNAIRRLSDKTDPETAPDYVILADHITSISMQLHALGVATVLTPTLGDLDIPLSPVVSPIDYAGELAAGKARESGLVAVLSSKSLIDMPALLRTCKDAVLFEGYSNRALFRRDENIAALQDILSAGRSVRILVVDPTSTVADLRSREPAYKNENDFREDLEGTLADARRFMDRAVERHGAEYARQHFDLRVYQRVPACSYFLVDDLCVFSLYSRRLTGSRGPAFVYRETRTELNSYYAILKQDFEQNFAGGASLWDLS